MGPYHTQNHKSSDEMMSADDEIIAPTSEDLEFIGKVPRLKAAYHEYLKSKQQPETKCGSPHSLKNLCFKDIAAYFKLYKKHGPVLSRILSRDLKNQMLSFMLDKVMLDGSREYLMQARQKLFLKQQTPSINDQHEIVFQLLNDTTKRLNLFLTGHENWTDFKDRQEYFWQRLSENAPKVESLSFECFQQDIHPSHPFLRVTPMMHLQHLSVRGWKWTDDDLIVLGEKCPKLITVQLSEIDILISSNGLKTLKQNQLLRGFYFNFKEIDYEDFEGNRKTRLHLRAIFIEHLPWLTYIGEYLELEYFEELCYSYEMDTFDLPGVFQLKQLVATKTLPSKASLPNLRLLFFQGPFQYRRCLDTFATYTKLVKLGVSGTPMDQLTLMFEALGSNLKFLSIMNTTNFDFIETFYLCPNLICFQLKGSLTINNHTYYQHKISAKNFEHLQTFEVEFCKEAPEGLLKFVFNAPFVKSIKIDDLIMKPQECQELLNALQDNKFQHLESIYFFKIMNSDPSFAESIAAITKSLILNAPKLYNINNVWSFGNHELYEAFHTRRDLKFLNQLFEFSRKIKYL